MLTGVFVVWGVVCVVVDGVTIDVCVVYAYVVVSGCDIADVLVVVGVVIDGVVVCLGGVYVDDVDDVDVGGVVRGVVGCGVIGFGGGGDVVGVVADDDGITGVGVVDACVGVVVGVWWCHW